MTVVQHARATGRFVRVVVWATAVVLTVILAAVTASLVAGRRREVLRVSADRAERSVWRARRAEAMTWAPEALLEAEATWHDGVKAVIGQDARLWPLPDYATAREAFAHTERAAKRALEQATAVRDTARRGAADAIDRASAAVSESDTLAARIHLTPERRVLLARARLVLEEARALEQAGDYGTATVRADRAVESAEQVRDQAAAVAARYADAQLVRTWGRWKAETIGWSRQTGRVAIVVGKETHEVTVYVRGEPVRRYRADMGFNWVVDKRRAGDGATPEGQYRIVAKKDRGASRYYRAMLLDYPNPDDRRAFARAQRSGELPASARIGGLIEIHGEGGRGTDWTHGCVAVSNADIDDLFARAEVGTPVTIIGNDEPGALAVVGNSLRDTPGVKP